MFALFPEFGARTRPQDLWPFLISETGLKFLIWTQGKIHPSNNSVLPAVPFLAWFIRRAARQVWLLRKFPPGMPASQYWDPS